MLHGFFFVAVFSVLHRFLRLQHCVSICLYAFTHCLIRQTDNTVYHNLFGIQKPLTGFLCYAQTRNNQPCNKPYNNQVL
jgi:hypothetical protein